MDLLLQLVYFIFRSMAYRMYVSIRQKMTKLSVQSPEPTALRAATHLLSDYLGSGLVYTEWNVCGIQVPHRSEKKETAIYATL